ncbi:MAG: serine/threonine protein kinase [Ktedonobacterales bacterium]|nr:serine/threonine protein kinase [Ktedonobacterales bacterium]
MDTIEGRQVGQYLIEQEIGRGSMGAVYRAHHLSTPNQPVAIKILLAALATDNSFITRFNRETDALRAMRHPHVIRILDGGQDGQLIYYVMEYINGTTVGALLKQKQRIPVAQAVEIGAQVADALDYIHNVGKLIHRDIKPDNIMVDRWVTAKVLDFGLARIDGAYTITRAGMVVGSLYYVPSEHLRGEKIDGRADIYALGVSLYEMMTGERPFRGKTLQEMSKAIAAGNPMPPSLLEPTIPLELEQIVLKALARKREDRYSRANELCEALRQLQGHMATQQVPTDPPTQIMSALAHPPVAMPAAPPPLDHAAPRLPRFIRGTDAPLHPPQTGGTEGPNKAER